MRVCEWISGTRKGLGSRIRSADIAAGVSVFRRPPSLPSPFASQRGVRIGLHEFWHWPISWTSWFRSGEVTDHGELARLGHVSPARLCQYMTLLHLAPAIQQYLLLLAVSQASPISEVGLRRIARESRWDRQRAVFESLLVRKGCLRPPSVSALVWQLTVLDALGVRR